jgi:uncharacterized protein YcfL
MKSTYQYILILMFFMITACSPSSSKNENTSDATQSTTNSTDNATTDAQSEEEQTSSESIDGTYSYSDNSADLSITIYGTTWYGKTIIKTGNGAEFDAQNAESDNGIIKGNDLYDSSGSVKVGYVSGNSLTTSVGGSSVTLSK